MCVKRRVLEQYFFAAAMPPPDDEVVTGQGSSTSGEERVSGGDSKKPVRYFTSEELRKLNRPHNAHVAVRGKVRNRTRGELSKAEFTHPRCTM